MKTISNLVTVVLAGCCTSRAQALAPAPNPALIGSSYTLTQSFAVAPGQLVTMIVDLGVIGAIPSSGIYETVRAPAGADLPSSLAGVSGGYADVTTNPPSPQAYLEVRPYWGFSAPYNRDSRSQLAAITIQIPFEAKCKGCGPLDEVGAGSVRFDLGGKHGSSVDVSTFPDQVHVLTTCDAFMMPPATVPTNPFSLPPGTYATVSVTGLPCPSVVAHGDGSLVSAQSPALPGEVVIAYAVGLGQTNPPLQTGKIVTAPAPTQATFGLDFNYHPNALASKPLPSAPPPLYSGATPGFVGLYQVNFAVPSPPPGMPPCVVPKTSGENVVYSNLTVSVGGASSFDAARLCVAVNP